MTDNINNIPEIPERPVINIFSPFDARDYKMVASKGIDYPEEFTLPVCAVKNQGVVSSCVAHAMSSIMEYYTNLQHQKYVPMSIGYLYGNRTQTSHKGEGYILRDMLKIAKKYGDAAEVDFPYNLEVPSIIDKFEERDKNIDKDAYKNRISSYYRVTSEKEIKYALLNECPVIIAMKWYKKDKVKDGILTFDSDVQSGSHCMFIYGWNEKGWKVQNSYGTNWGDNGRCIVPYDMEVRELWAITDSISDELVDYKKPNVLLRWFYWIINEFVALVKKFKKEKEE